LLLSGEGGEERGYEGKQRGDGREQGGGAGRDGWPGRGEQTVDPGRHRVLSGR
jgi:hypothetical protein